MDIKSYRAEMNFIFRQAMDFSIILVGGHALRKSVLTVSTKHVKMIFFVPPSSHSDTYLTHLEFICHRRPDFQLCWKMTLATINTECLKTAFDYCINKTGITWAKLLLQGQKYVSRAPRLHTDSKLQQPVYHESCHHGFPWFDLDASSESKTEGLIIYEG